MALKAFATRIVPISRIFLCKENPRHEPVEAEGQAIEKLCSRENIIELARDIVRYGTNPLEMTGLVPNDERKSFKGETSYIVAEGNRRLCALKLLKDPDLAPANMRKQFEQMAKEWSPIAEVSAVIFPTMKDARIWMERIHNGPQGGIGRKNWNSDQKARFDGESKNKAALALLDYAEQMKFINQGERARRLTTAQRFLSNDVFRETVGVDHSDPELLSRIRPKSEFDIILRRFVRDLVEGKVVNSRMNKKEIIDYSRALNGLSGVTAARVEPEPLIAGSGNPKATKANKKTPRKPEKVSHIQYHEEIYQALRTLGNNKLQSLYHSICSVDLGHHTPLVSIGVWSFFETLTACAGRTDGTSFDSFLSKARLASLGVTGNTSTLLAAMGRIRDYGNTTKHHPVAATFNGDQLNNDMNTLKEVILKCVAEAVKRAR